MPTWFELVHISHQFQLVIGTCFDLGPHSSILATIRIFCSFVHTYIYLICFLEEKKMKDAALMPKLSVIDM
jgi:hypothetical protein